MTTLIAWRVERRNNGARISDVRREDVDAVLAESDGAGVTGHAELQQVERLISSKNCVFQAADEVASIPPRRSQLDAAQLHPSNQAIGREVSLRVDMTTLPLYD